MGPYQGVLGRGKASARPEGSFVSDWALGQRGDGELTSAGVGHLAGPEGEDLEPLTPNSHHLL